MAILFALVARGTVVLAEFSAVTGNTGTVARRILEKLPAEADSRLCFSQDRYIFHILRSDGLTYLCISNDTFGRRIPFSYLEDIQMRFMKNYSKVANYAPAYAMNDEFSRVLHQQMEFFSSNPSADTLNRVRGEVGEVPVLFKEHGSFPGVMAKRISEAICLFPWKSLYVDYFTNMFPKSLLDFKYALSWWKILRKYWREVTGLSFLLIRQQQCKTVHFTLGNSPSAFEELFG